MFINNAIQRFIVSQGPDGEMLLRILESIEVLGIIKYTNEELQDPIKIYVKVKEFEVAVKAAFLNWTSGIAEQKSRYGVCNWFDAWRKLCNKYVTSVEDLQNILIQ